MEIRTAKPQSPVSTSGQVVGPSWWRGVLVGVELTGEAHGACLGRSNTHWAQATQQGDIQISVELARVAARLLGFTRPGAVAPRPQEWSAEGVLPSPGSDIGHYAHLGRGNRVARD